MSDAQAFLLSAAREARAYFQRKQNGELQRGMYEEIGIWRTLDAAIEEVEAERAVDELFARR